jgi:hypothetical protein
MKTSASCHSGMNMKFQEFQVEDKEKKRKKKNPKGRDSCKLH